MGSRQLRRVGGLYSFGFSPVISDPAAIGDDAIVIGRWQRTAAYFLTTVVVGEKETAAMRFSTIDAMALSVNGRFAGYSEGERYAWYDFGVNPDHPPTSYTELPLAPGANQVLIRVRGGIYSTGGFYAAVHRVPAPSAEP